MSMKIEEKGTGPVHYQPYVEPRILNDDSVIEGNLHHGTGIGKRTFTDGHVYSGQLVSWLLHGQGAHILPCGTRLEGTFVQGVLHGPGKITYTDGRIDDGIFENGRLAFRRV